MRIVLQCFWGVGFAIPESGFFPVEQLAFQVMPSIQVQSTVLSTYRQRLLKIIDRARRKGQTLSIAQAERLALQQFEEELVQLLRQKDMKGVRTEVKV